MHCPKQIDHCSDLVLSLHVMTLCSRRYLGNAGVSLAGILSSLEDHSVCNASSALQYLYSGGEQLNMLQSNPTQHLKHGVPAHRGYKQCTVTCAVQVVWECSYISERRTGQLCCAGRCQSVDQCLRS